MTRQEFLKGTKEIEKKVISYSAGGLCFRIERLSEITRIVFEDFFSPQNSHAYWLADYANSEDYIITDDNMDNLERRLMFLECFKQWALCYKVYEVF